MTVDESLQAMAAIEGQYDGTQEKASLVVTLYSKLLTDPEGFWDFYWENAMPKSHFRELAERLLRSGEITEGSTFADARKALEKYSAVKDSQ